MLLKSADSKDEIITELESLLCSAPSSQQDQIKRQIRNIKAGEKGEQDAAYYLEFDYKNSQNYLILHDLRLEVGGRVAQIDHILINRFLNCFVFESKYFHSGFKITEEGEFLRWNDYKKCFEGMPSPLAQNERHVAVLRDAFGEIKMPTRLGHRLNPSFHPYVLVSPNARIDRPKDFDSSKIIKADVVKQTIVSHFNNENALETLFGAAKMIAKDTLQAIGQSLISMHTPLKTDWSKHFSCHPTDKLKVTEPAKPEAIHSHSTDKLKVTEPDKQIRGPICKHCSGTNGSILYGKYGYYLKCSDCSANTAIKVACTEVGHKARIRKDGRNFYQECEACGSSKVYFINPE